MPPAPCGERVTREGRVSASLIDREQRAAHGLAGFATYAEAIRQLSAYAERVSGAGPPRRDLKNWSCGSGSANSSRQMLGGIPMSQGEMVRPGGFLGLALDAVGARVTPAIEELIATGNTAENRARLVALMREHHGATVGDCGLDDTLESIREEMRKFADSEVVPHAHGWHLADSYIPIDVIEQLAALGVFGLTIPEEFGGMGLGKGPCASSRGIVARLYRRRLARHALGDRRRTDPRGGTDAQKSEWLPKSLPAKCCRPRCSPSRTRAPTWPRSRRAPRGTAMSTSRQQDLDHAPGRADLMTLLVRTDPKEPGYRGLSMLLAEKPRGTRVPVSGAGMSGGEIEVLGYRGMREYEIGFDGFEVSADELLGGTEGRASSS